VESKVRTDSIEQYVQVWLGKQAFHVSVDVVASAATVDE
jgi:hypothetical protein